jgi:hypothetical protein
MRHPPAFGNWLLEQLASQEPLVGDLTEEYARGRSRAWYWKELLVAVLVGGFEDIREHKLVTLRAVAVGWAFLIFWIGAFNLTDWWQTIKSSHDGVAYWAIPAVGFIANGWVVGRFHSAPMVFAFLVALLAGSMLRRFGLAPEWLPTAITPSGWFALMAAIAIPLGVLLSSLSGRRGLVPPFHRRAFRRS